MLCLSLPDGVRICFYIHTRSQQSPGAMIRSRSELEDIVAFGAIIQVIDEGCVGGMTLRNNLS